MWILILLGVSLLIIIGKEHLLALIGKVQIFSKTILNILSNFILHKTIECDDKDPLYWMTNKVKDVLWQKTKYLKT